MRSGGMANVIIQYWSEGITQMELFDDADKDFETMKRKSKDIQIELQELLTQRFCSRVFEDDVL